MSQTTLLMAAKEYIDRQRGKRSPTGEWVGNIYFFPDKYKEKLKCCEKYLIEIEMASIVMYEHLKSIEHIANLYEVKAQDLELLINTLKSTGRTK